MLTGNQREIQLRRKSQPVLGVSVMVSDQNSVADAIRAEIAKIPSSELASAKPVRILPLLEVAGFEITPSVRSATSKLLGIAKNSVEKPAKTGIVSFDPIASQKATCRELAMQLVEACGGNFDLVREEIARLETFARKIKGA